MMRARSCPQKVLAYLSKCQRSSRRCYAFEREGEDAGVGIVDPRAEGIRVEGLVPGGCSAVPLWSSG